MRYLHIRCRWAILFSANNVGYQLIGDLPCCAR